MREELHCFPYDTTVSGKVQHYRMIEDEHRFGIEQDGAVSLWWKIRAGAESNDPESRSVRNH